MNKIGFNLLAWSASIGEEFYPHIERLRETGYDILEFAMGNRDPKAYQALGTFLNGLGMEATAVTVLPPEANPVSSDAAMRRKAVDLLKQDIDMAADAGSRILCGPIHSAFATFSNAAPTEEECQYSAEVLRAAGDHAEQADVTLAVESLNRFECYLSNTTAQLKHICDLAGHSRVKAMFDTHHANIEEKSIPGAIDTIAPHLVHVHISENDRGTPGDGHINFTEVFDKLREINYTGPLVIEAFTRDDVDFANAINVWRTFSEPWDIAEQGLSFIQQQLQRV
jgi:D-psicose/D-tagatose/L-ribulose 3-epimerase